MRSDEDSINQTTPHSQTTALMLASRYCRKSIVEKLLQSKAKVNAKDLWDCSALFYASQFGYHDIVRMLLKSKPPPPLNDGSLHEAARELHGRIVDELIRAKHDPNFISYKHGGRNALAELCYAAATNEQGRLEEVLDALVRGGVKPTSKYRGKTALFLALDNPAPEAMVIKFVERVMYKDINSRENIYEENDFFYSPTVYIKKHLLEAYYDEHSRRLL